MIFGGDRRCSRHVEKIRNFEEKTIIRCLVDPFCGRVWSSARGSVREFSISGDINCGAPGAHLSTIKNLSLIYWFSKYILLKHQGDLRSIGKSCVKTSAMTENFSKNTKFNLGWWWIKPFWVGTACLTIEEIYQIGPLLLFNRPGVARAVLQSPFLLIH